MGPGPARSNLYLKKLLFKDQAEKREDCPIKPSRLKKEKLQPIRSGRTKQVQLTFIEIGLYPQSTHLAAEMPSLFY